MKYLSIIIALFFCATSCLGMFRSKGRDCEDETTTINPLVKTIQEKGKIKKGGEKEEIHHTLGSFCESTKGRKSKEDFTEEIKKIQREKLLKVSRNTEASLKEAKKRLKKEKRFSLKKSLKAQSLPEMDKPHSEAKNKKKSKKMPKSINKKDIQKARSSLKGETHPLVPPLNISKVQAHKEKLGKDTFPKEKNRSTSMRELPTARLTPSSGKSSPSATQSLKSLPLPSSTSDLKNSTPRTPRSLFRNWRSKSDELLEMKKRRSISPRHENFKKNKKKWWRTSRQQQLDMMLDLVLDHECETMLTNFCVLNMGQEKYQKKGIIRKKILAAGLP